MTPDGNLSNLMGLARTALLAGNNDEALTYFNRVLEADPTVSEAWIGKGKAAGWQSTLKNIRIGETTMAFNHAIATAPDAGKAKLTSELVIETNKIIVAVYSMARKHLNEFVAVDGLWIQYLGQVRQLLDGLGQVQAWEPTNRTTLENIVHLCKDNIEGITYRDFHNNPQAWYLSPEYEALIKSRLDSAVADLRMLDPAYAPPKIEKKQAAACFVVTATMGDPNHPTVELLRQFRDQHLTQSEAGKKLIRHYYRIGPNVAAFIAKSPIRRAASYWLVVRPAAGMAKRMMRGLR